jgi:hypothetical protein
VGPLSSCATPPAIISPSLISPPLISPSLRLDELADAAEEIEDDPTGTRISNLEVGAVTTTATTVARRVSSEAERSPVLGTTTPRSAAAAARVGDLELGVKPTQHMPRLILTSPFFYRRYRRERTYA